jgi:hypothetical protein
MKIMGQIHPNTDASLRVCWSGCNETVDQTMPGNEGLRRELDPASGLRARADYRARFQLLEAQYGHTIAILREGISEIARFNCFAYAFGVWDEPTYRHFVDERQSSSLINSDLVSEMPKHGDLAELSEEQVRPGSVALYFAHDALRHAGIVEATSATPGKTRFCRVRLNH